MLQGQRVAGFGKLEKFVQPAANHVGKRKVEQVGEAAVDGEDLAVIGNAKKEVFKGVDQVAIALLGSGNQRKELIELVGVLVRSRALLDAADQSP